MQTIHPFPARMAPELASEVLSALPVGSRILDPMCGSGTVLRQAVERGHWAVGRDLDPLAVLITRACVALVRAYRLLHDAQIVVERAKNTAGGARSRPWNDQATERFARYWFADKQLHDLTRLAVALRQCRLPSRDLMKVCFSRMIITKERGASLGPMLRTADLIVWPTGTTLMSLRAS